MNNISTVESPFGDELWVVLGRYTSGESTPAEIEQVRRWLAQYPRREHLLSRLDQVARSLAPAQNTPTNIDTEGQWRRLEPRLDGPEVVDLNARRVRRYIIGLRAAAMVLLAVGST